MASAHFLTSELMTFGSFTEISVGMMLLFLMAFVLIGSQTAKSFGVQAPEVQQSQQQPSALRKKKGAFAKKGRKARGFASSEKKSSPDAAPNSDDELEASKMRSASDIEAPSMAKQFVETELNDSIQTSHEYLSAENTTTDTESDNLEILVCLGDTKEDASDVCEMCSMPKSETMGCETCRTYTPLLLLRHCEMQRIIARGAPGLEAPKALDQQVSLPRAVAQAACK